MTLPADPFKPRFTANDWISLISLGVTTVTQIMAARAQRKAELAALSPEVEDMTDAEFEAVFGKFRTAADDLSKSAAGLVEQGARERDGGGS